VTAKELQTALIDGCETTREPLQGYFEEQSAKTEATPRRFFPDIPEEEFDRLLAESVARTDKLAETYDPQKCEGQYETDD
jgi:hypothetical protein